MVVSLKANRKRILAFLVLAVIVALACFFLQSRGEEEPAQPIPGGTNEERVAYLQSFGWQVQTEPTETREVMIPAEFNDVYTAYNTMQKAQGFDLEPYAGESCTQYLYKVENYPNETEVYATLLVYGDQIIGGDVASTKVDGFMHGFAPDSARFGENNGGAGSGQSSASPVASPTPAASQLPAESGVDTAVESSADTAAETSQTEAAAPEAETSAETETAGEPLPEDAYPVD
ncbi:MAG: DUF4830 domain-containing protein [Acutalibacter sp.]|jgi:hypothetical protein